MASKTRQFYVRITGIFTACVLLVQLLGMGPLQVFCAMTEMVGERCCCPEKAKTPDRESPSLEAAPCCEVLQSTQHIQARNFELPTQSFQNPLWVAQSAPPTFAPPQTTSTQNESAWNARGPPPDHSPALYIQNCTYLI
jgi:hypothetical protein